MARRGRALAAAMVFALFVHAPTAAAGDDWQVTPGGHVTGVPQETNAQIDAVLLRCRRDFVIGVVTPARRLRPKRDYTEEEALFDDVFGRATAVVDEERFELGVGGANDEATIYLFAREPDALLGALRGGRSMTLSFDILPEDAKDGAGFETVARFDLIGLDVALTEAGTACRPSGSDQ